ncbi:armadillo repeat-containing protein 1-like [Vespa velutina]|uniref:armadillo repeat-containing protein 1-like n=1 Tax=Vespa crabro TaxID=7445 RepID=UPI001F0146B7|nr:armadillo repeat-containing protein 1-like [Vespa crabro]XP_046832457.1 armadillo repeat-containing protein 1-like [Vespa crabro]XP_047364362.1 armadillo repeat-containing protein 1-like [Vespa velutina]XP_047364364.1 armadillo repeat-containing protein 1-like [Vespa velutina]XP_047364365.1 armadillo repeat-containing protein 1-like [Vespa velutina]XP_047364366.1 armadillo repeat-containing protein 1-like [Vespa velutina]
METEEYDNPKEIRATLETYKKLADDFSNHDTILKDKTVLSYIAYILEVPYLDIINLSLDILELFIKNADNYLHITSTFGIREALDAVVNRFILSEPEISKRAQHLKDNIERMKPPIYNLRSRCRIIERKKLKTHVIVLHVQGLLPETRSELESTLIKIEGLISLVIDVEHQRVTMRTLNNVTAKQIAEAIQENLDNMEAWLVTKNKFNQEFLVRLTHKEDTDDIENMPEYLPEEEEQEDGKEGVVSLFSGLRQSASSLYKSTAEFLHNSFYW